MTGFLGNLRTVRSFSIYFLVFDLPEFPKERPRYESMVFGRKSGNPKIRSNNEHRRSVRLLPGVSDTRRNAEKWTKRARHPPRGKAHGRFPRSVLLLSGDELRSEDGIKKYTLSPGNRIR